MSSDLSQGLLRTLYLTFSHNELVTAYVIGLVISAIMAFKKPSRYHLMLLMGFAVLAFNFEYDKHIIDGLRDQTMVSIISDPGKHFGAQRFISLVITELVPVMLYVFGWGMIFAAIITQGVFDTFKFRK